MKKRKKHPKPSQNFLEQFGHSVHKMKGFSRNLPQQVHPNFAQNLGRHIIGNTFSGLKQSNFLNALFLQWGFYEFKDFRDGPHFFKEMPLNPQEWPFDSRYWKRGVELKGNSRHDRNRHHRQTVTVASLS